MSRRRFSLIGAKEVALLGRAERRGQAPWGLEGTTSLPLLLLEGRVQRPAPKVPALSALEIPNKLLKAKPPQNSLMGSLFWFPYEQPEVP